MFISRYDFDICIQILNIIQVWIFRERERAIHMQMMSIHFESSYSDDTHNNISTMQFIQVNDNRNNFHTAHTAHTAHIAHTESSFYEFVTTPKIIIPFGTCSKMFCLSFFFFFLLFYVCFCLVAWHSAFRRLNLTLI